MFNLANARSSMAISALINGCALKLLGQSREAYLVLFGLSSFARAATLVFLKLASAPEDCERETALTLTRLQPATVPTPVPATVSAPSK